MNLSDQIRLLRQETISPSTLEVYLNSITNFVLYLDCFDPFAQESQINSPHNYACPLTLECKLLLNEWHDKSYSQRKRLLKGIQ